MDKYKKFYGIIITAVIVVLSLYFAITSFISPKFNAVQLKQDELNKKQNDLSTKREDLNRRKERAKVLENSVLSSPKKLFTPNDSDLGNDALFFTMYNDVIEMAKNNSIKIRSIAYEYSPAGDAFVTNGGDKYFVCDVNMTLVSNFVKLGNFVQDIYQYPYYIKINSIEVTPHENDKTILNTKLSLRLYANTSPDVIIDTGSEDVKNQNVKQ